MMSDVRCEMLDGKSKESGLAVKRPSTYEQGRRTGSSLIVGITQDGE